MRTAELVTIPDRVPLARSVFGQKRKRSIHMHERERTAAELVGEWLLRAASREKQEFHWLNWLALILIP